jgi:hypothetical protein
VRSVATSPRVEWSTQRRLEYVEFCAAVVNELRGTSPILEAEFVAASMPNSVVQLTALNPAQRLKPHGQEKATKSPPPRHRLNV